MFYTFQESECHLAWTKCIASLMSIKLWVGIDLKLTNVVWISTDCLRFIPGNSLHGFKISRGVRPTKKSYHSHSNPNFQQCLVNGKQLLPLANYHKTEQLMNGITQIRAKWKHYQYCTPVKSVMHQDFEGTFVACKLSREPQGQLAYENNMTPSKKLHKNVAAIMKQYWEVPKFLRVINSLKIDVGLFVQVGYHLPSALGWLKPLCP